MLGGQRTPGGYDMRITQGATPEFDQFITSYRARLRLSAFAICGDWQLADDLVQEASMVLHSHWHSIEPTARAAYARTVMWRVATRLHTETQSLRVQLPSVISQSAMPPTEEEEEEKVVDRLVVRNALHDLPARQQRVVQLRFWGGLSTAEIARLLGMPAGTVRSDLTRAVAQLKGVLGASFNTRERGLSVRDRQSYA